MNVNLFYTLLLLCLLALLARWIKSKEAEWIGSYGEYKVRKAIKNIEATSSENPAAVIFRFDDKQSLIGKNNMINLRS